MLLLGPALAVSAVWLAAPTRPTPLPAVYSATVPIRLTSRNAPLVEVTVGRERVWMMIDTGASGTAFTVRTAERLGLPPTNYFADTTIADGRQVRSRYHEVPRVTVGGCLLAAHSGFEVVDMPSLAAVGAEAGIEVGGLLGGDLLREADAEVDYGRRVLRLAPPWAGDLRLMQGEWVATDISRSHGPIRPATRDNMHTVRLTVSGWRMRLDLRGTGAGGVLVDEDFSLRPGVTPRQYMAGDMWQGGRRMRPCGRGSYAGLYEVTADRLRLLAPVVRVIPPDDLPRTLTGATPEQGMTLYTFRRLFAPSPGLPDLLLAAVGVGEVYDRPVRLGGWEWAVTPDWALTASHPGRRQRLTVRLDGSLALQPLRP